jgi:nucleoside-diphosphate-sugar epimerase/predicted dehydrogenase
MIEEQKPDIVHVLVSPQYHAELSIEAMNRGCHVLVEKPMALTVDDAEKMISVAKLNNVRLCVNHNMVYESVVQRALQIASTGKIGKVVSAAAYYQFDARRYPAILEEGAEYCHWSFRMNGGPLQDLMPHPASLVCELIGEISNIEFTGKNIGVLPRPWQDEMRVLIDAKGSTGYISISLSEKPDVILFILKGTRGTVEANLFNDILILQRKSNLPRAIARGLSGFSIASQALKGSVANIVRFLAGRIDKSNGVAALVSKFYESIAEGTEAPISLEKSLRVVDLTSHLWPSSPTHFAETESHVTREFERPMPTALVTGASGFIGTHLVKKLLSENIRVRALVRPNSIHAGRLRNVDVDVIEGDLSNRDAINEAVRGINTIYHAGASMSDSWQEHEEITIGGTETLVAAALTNRVERFIHFSTLAVFELLDVNHTDKISEDSPFQKSPKRMGPYSFAKIETEKIVLDAHRSKGLGVTIVRPGMVIGPMGRVFFPHLGYRYQDSVFLIIGKGDKILPLTYVENTVDGIYKASVLDNAIGQSYNLIDDGDVTVNEYLEKFVNINGASASVFHLPYILPYSATLAYEIFASFGFLKKGITSRAQLKWKQSRLLFDNAKAKRDLDWTPRISLDEGLEKTFSWYAKNYGPNS